MLIRNVRPWGAEPADIEIADGRIAAVRPVSQREAQEGEADSAAFPSSSSN